MRNPWQELENGTYVEGIYLEVHECVFLSRVRSPLIKVITMTTRVITLLISIHEPPRRI